MLPDLTHCSSCGQTVNYLYHCNDCKQGSCADCAWKLKLVVTLQQGEPQGNPYCPQCLLKLPVEQQQRAIPFAYRN